MDSEICIISLSPLATDARVLRQVKALSQLGSVTVIALAPLPDSRSYINTQFKSVSSIMHTGFKRLYSRAVLIGGKAIGRFLRKWYWMQPMYRDALKIALESNAKVFYANDLMALPIAAEAAEKTGGKLIFDAHEYSPLESEDSLLWRMFIRPFVEHVLRCYGPRVNAGITVCRPIADRYKNEFGISMQVILNAPEAIAIGDRERTYERVRLIHHGVSMSRRKLELMIDVVSHCDQRYSLAYMLIPGREPEYLNFLRSYAKEKAPNRVEFVEPVPVQEIVKRVSDFDMGIFVMPPANYNWTVSLPNKFFDCLQAKIPFFYGDFPCIEEITNQYECGCGARTSDPKVLASVLNALEKDDFVRMQQGAVRASQNLNSNIEMEKLCQIVRPFVAGADN